MKNGFTLMEVLIVVLISAIIGVSSVVMYETTTNVTKEQELKNTYIDIQEAAMLYMDVESSALSSFRENQYLNVPISILQSDNYLDSELKNPVDNSEISSDYIVRIYIKKDTSSGKSFLNSCIVKRTSSTPECIANSDGENKNCCDY